MAWLETVPSQLLASKKSTQRARLAGSRMLWGSMAGFLRDHEGFDVFNFADDFGIIDCVRSGVGCIDRWNGAHRVAEVNLEGRSVQGFKLRNHISCVDDHLGLLDERQAEDRVYRDVASSRNKEARGVSFVCKIRQVETEGH